MLGAGGDAYVANELGITVGELTAGADTYAGLLNTAAGELGAEGEAGLMEGLPEPGAEELSGNGAEELVG